MGASAESAGSGVQDNVAEVVTTVRGKSGNMQAGLADWLDQSAQVIRDRATAATSPGEPAAGGDASDVSSSVLIPPQLANVADTAAGVLERSAMWLRENDLSEIEGRVTEQVKSRPVQSLLLAAGIGFLLSRGRD